MLFSAHVAHGFIPEHRAFFAYQAREHERFKSLWPPASHTLQASHALVVFDALRPWLPSDTRRRFQAGELLDNGAAFGAGRTGTSEVAEGLASFHRLYMTDRRERRVSRASGGVDTEGLRRHACGYEEPGRRTAAFRPTQAMILMYLHTVKDGSGDDRVACLRKVNMSALVKSKSCLGLDLR
jgi:hypothetical protein